MQLGRRRCRLWEEVCLQCLKGCWSFDLSVPRAAPRGVPLCVVFVSGLNCQTCVTGAVLCVCVRVRARPELLCVCEHS